MIDNEITNETMHRTISNKAVEAVSFSTFSYSFRGCFDVSLLIRIDNIAKNAETKIDRKTVRCSANSLVSTVT